jgi:hypothetical protein
MVSGLIYSTQIEATASRGGRGVSKIYATMKAAQYYGQRDIRDFPAWTRTVSCFRRMVWNMWE